MKRILSFLCCLLVTASVAWAEPSVSLKYSRTEPIESWRGRIQSFLSMNTIPIIDMESSMTRNNGEQYLENALVAMDRVGVALIILDGEQAPKDGTKGYRWGYYNHELVNAHPDRFILATNGGTNNNWVKQKGESKRDFITQTESQVRTGDYPIMGEFEFRHYMSSSQCRSKKHHRDVTVPLISINGHKLFALAQETGIPFLIHLEMENKQIDDLETMLTTYPGAKVIVCHFGQIRHPERQTRFSAKLARRLLNDHPNLYFDLSTGHPGRVYPCSGVLDTVIWMPSTKGQRDRLKPEYRAIITDFSHRFVAGFDYGGSRGDWASYIVQRAANIRLIIKGLPDEVQHDISYRTAWKLLTKEEWVIRQ